MRTLTSTGCTFCGRFVAPCLPAPSSAIRLTIPLVSPPTSRYSKRVKRTVRHTCHDDKGEAEVGDLVTLVPTRPLSKTKRFIVDEILLKGN